MGPDKEDAALRLAVIYDEKIGLLEEMLRLTSDRAGLDEAGQAEEILALIDARQALMEKADCLDAEIKRYAELPGGGDNPGLPGGPAAERRQACHDLVRRIMLLDRQQGPRLEEELERLKRQQAKLKAGRQAAGAYSGKPGQDRPEGIFVDEKK